MARLQHHASIVMWDLNNEGEAMMNWGNKGNWTEYYRQYTQFYVKELAPIMTASGVDLAANFMDSSPTSGAKSFQPYEKSGVNPGVNDIGDQHFYYLEMDCEDPATHPDVRFLSESGF